MNEKQKTKLKTLHYKNSLLLPTVSSFHKRFIVKYKHSHKHKCMFICMPSRFQWLMSIVLDDVTNTHNLLNHTTNFCSCCSITVDLISSFLSVLLLLLFIVLVPIFSRAQSGKFSIHIKC